MALIVKRRDGQKINTYQEPVRDVIVYLGDCLHTVVEDGRCFARLEVRLEGC